MIKSRPIPRKSLKLRKSKRLSPIRGGIKPKTGRKRRNPESISALIKKYDKVFSLYIRQKYADKDGIVLCYTCGHKSEIKKIHCGHYISRWYKITRWNENNCRPQCFMCNIYKKGDTANFRARLIKEIGQDKIEAMEAESINIWKMGTLEKEEMKSQIDYYTSLLKI